MGLQFPSYETDADGHERGPPSATMPNPPIYLHSDLTSALKQLSDPSLTTTAIHRNFVIGGASLYAQVLELLPSAQSTPLAIVDRILLTRIESPAFKECDVFMPDFLVDGSSWQKATHAELQAWVEFEVPEGMQEENGVEYEFQMWFRQP